MKLLLMIILFLTFVPVSFGQLPSATPTPPTKSISSDNSRTKAFGKSLEKYKNKRHKFFQNDQKSVDLENDTVLVTTDLVINDVLVTDQKGNIITGLKKDDFVVRENSELQMIEVFSSNENTSLSRSIVLIVDNSAAGFLPYRKSSIEAAKILIDNLNSNDKMAIVTGLDAKLLVDFTRDKTLLKNKLDALEKKTIPIGNGLEFDALLATLNEMFEAGDSYRIIIFQGNGNGIARISTGDDTVWQIYTSFLRNNRVKIPERYLEFSDITKAVEKSRATIYSVIPGIQVLGLSKKEQFARAKTSSRNFLDYVLSPALQRHFGDASRELQEAEVKRLVAAQTAMSTIAGLSGGNTNFIEKPEDAESVYANIFKNIKNRYVIGYYPTNQEQNGKRRYVKVAVRNHPEYIVTGRTAYSLR